MKRRCLAMLLTVSLVFGSVMTDGAAQQVWAATSENETEAAEEQEKSEVLELPEEEETAGEAAEMESVLETENAEDTEDETEILEMQEEDELTEDGSAEIVHEGTSNNIKWSIDSNGFLLVEGTGDAKLVCINTDWGSRYVQPWCEYSEEIVSAKVSVTGMTDASRFFYDCANLQSVDLTEFDTSSVMDMEEMFFYCGSLESLDLSSFNTENVMDMVSMFYRCDSLKSLDLSSFNTGNVTSMYEMFSGCSALESLDLSSFNTGNVSDMGEMFYRCDSLKSLDLSSFNTENVSDMGEMFSGCSALESLDLSSFNTGNVSGMGGMFYRCDSLKSLDLSSFNTGNVTSMYEMFSGCSALESLDLSSFNTGNVSGMGEMFCECSALESLDLSSFNTENVQSMGFMFGNCSALKSLDLSSFNTENVQSMDSMFSSCKALKSLDLSSFNMKDVLYTGYMLWNCEALEKIITPRNCSQTVELPCNFQAEDGTKYTSISSDTPAGILLRRIVILFFNGNGATSGSMDEQFVECGTKTTLSPNNFKREGYTFVGWNTLPGGSGDFYADEADVSISKLTDKAYWQIMLFAQWRKEAPEQPGTGEQDKPNTQAPEVKPQTYKITYALNGGKNNSANPTTYNNQSAITLKNPTRTGYTFAGWYADKTFKTKVARIAAGSTGDKKLYAKWTANRYTLVYNGNGSTRGKTSKVSCTYGKSYTLKNNSFKKDGYQFKSWNTKKNGKGKTYKNKASVKNLLAKNKGTITLYAQWTPVKYKITYKLNKGKNASKNPKTYTTDKAVKLQKPTRKGYTFAGWYTDKACKKKVTKIGKGKIGKVTLYAKWKKK